MNKYQVALNVIKEKRNIISFEFAIVDDNDISKHFEATEVLQELVDRATPKKPNKETDSVYGTSYYCSNCGTFITRIIDEQRKEEIFNKDKGCKHCLHEIDWSEEK